MTVLRPRSRRAAALGLLAGTAASISLAGFVWAQAPSPPPESWPFDEQSETQAAPPAPQPKSAVQQRLEELYRRDGRPLPDYMQQQTDSSAQASPSAPAAADSQGNVRQQLSDYYQNQGRTMPAQPAAGGSQSAQQAASAPPSKPSLLQRLNPFHHDAASSASAQSQKQAQNSTSAPVAKSSSFWGDISLGRTEPASSRRQQVAISVELGPSARLVPKKHVPAHPAASESSMAVTDSASTLAPPIPAVPAVVAVPAAPSPVAHAVVSVPADPLAGPNVDHKVTAANAVAPIDMPFKDSDADADQKSGDSPYSGLTLEDEQNQLAPPPSRAAAPSAATADAHHPANSQPAKSADSAAKPAPAHKAHPLADITEPAAPPVPQHPAAKAHSHRPQSPSEKLRLVGERTGQRGFKGFCPVVLRDQRELVDGKSAYTSVYRSRIYRFSSAEAQARFDAAPRKYAPVAGGLDIVVKANSDQDVEGLLDFALWYKDRLYFFCSPESLQAFSLNPAAYAATAQRLE